jgi:hypothetical protein
MILASLVLAQSLQGRADLVYYCCGDPPQRMVIFVETKPPQPVQIDLCKARLFAVPIEPSGPMREVPFSERDNCGREPATTLVDQAFDDFTQQNQPAQVEIHPETLFERTGAFRLVLRTDPGFVRAQDGTAVAISGPRYTKEVQFYIPTPGSDDVSSLVQHFAHRNLWVYGDHLFQCDESNNPGTVTIRDHHPITVASIQRVPGVEWEPLGSHDGKYCWGYCSDYGAYFVAVDPLRVTLSLPPGSYQNTSRGPFSLGDMPPNVTGRCPTAYQYVADAWDFERLFSTTDPRIPHPGWDPGLIAPMLSFQAVPGMTAEMTAFALGFPSEFGTVDELLGENVWQYYPGSTLDRRATFEGGILTKITPSDRFYFQMDVY